VITKSEIDNKIAEFEINPADVEKDYVYGHILKAIYADSPLAGHLILKGGNALRKAYLPNTRFSKDLDFSTSGRLDPSFLKEELNRICLDVESRTGIAFDTSKTLVKGKNLPIPNVEALEARAYFKGFYGEEKILLKAQLDVTEFDKIFLPVQSRDLIHPYPDAASCTATVQCQKDRRNPRIETEHAVTPKKSDRPIRSPVFDSVCSRVPRRAERSHIDVLEKVCLRFRAVSGKVSTACHSASGFQIAMEDNHGPREEPI